MKRFAAWAVFAVLVGSAGLILIGGQQEANATSCEEPAESLIPGAWEPWFDEASEVQVLSVPVPSFTAGGRAQIENIQAGTLLVDRRGPMLDLTSVDWADESHGNYYSTQLHGLVGVGAAFELGQELPTEVEAAIGEHIENWALCAGQNPDINSRAWFEGTVIKRQANLLNALYYLENRGSLGPISKQDLLYLIDANARYLLDEPDVYAFGNHGIRQDMLLAATALSLPDHPRAQEMLEVAQGRLENSADLLFTNEGVWMEHAPGYVNYALRLMAEVDQLSEVPAAFNPERFLSGYDSSLEYLLSSLLPDGNIPYVGVSNASHVSNLGTRGAELDPELTSRARSLQAYPNYGHAIVRGNHPDGLYLLFVASQNLPAGKRHSDELSFLLYNHGRPWITEGGHSASQVSGMGQYLPSPWAHNTYTLDNAYIREMAEPDLDVNLLDAMESDGLITLRGESARFASEASFERTIEVADYAGLSIRDTLAGEGAWEGRLHLPGDLAVAIAEGVVSARDPEGREMTLTFRSDADLSFETCHSETDPICGWANADHEFGPATTVIWSFENAATVEIDIAWSEHR